jgi:hypothetical protein
LRGAFAGFSSATPAPPLPQRAQPPQAARPPRGGLDLGGGGSLGIHGTSTSGASVWNGLGGSGGGLLGGSLDLSGLPRRPGVVGGGLLGAGGLRALDVLGVLGLDLGEGLHEFSFVGMWTDTVRIAPSTTGATALVRMHV